MKSASTNTQRPVKDNVFTRFAARHEALWQFIKFALLGLVASLVEFGIFALCDFWLFAPLKSRELRWWLIDYSVANGGLCAFWSFVISYAAGQIVNFIIQRKYTFHARSNPTRSAILYAIALLLLYVYTLWLPTVIRAPLSALLGDTLGDLAVKVANMFSSMLILFPINKFIIMR